MELEDELSYNVFFFLLRNEHRKKYDFALTKCWIICVPCGDSLRDISFVEDMFDEHILKPLPQPNGSLLFTDMREQYLYKIEDNSIKLISGSKVEANHEVKILSTEKGFNNEFQPYNILLLDRPIHKKWECNKRTDRVKLNRQIRSWDEAVDFLKDIPNMEADYLENVKSTSEKMNAVFSSERENKKENDVREGVRQLIRDCWQLVMRRQSLALQRDERFQKLLSMSIEIYVMRFLHDALYELSGRLSAEQDKLLKAKIDRLNERGVEPERMGLSAELVELATFAIVELANLDSRKSPFEKLMCLKECMKFLVTEVDNILIKNAKEENTHSQDLLKNKKSKNSLNEKTLLSSNNREVLPITKNTPVNNTFPSGKFQTNDLRTVNYGSKIAQLDNKKLITFLMFVVIKTKPEAFIANLNYMKNFTWFVSPTEDLMYILDIFRIAVVSILHNLDENIFGSEKSVDQDTKMENNFSKWIDNRDLNNKMKPNLSNVLKENMKFLFGQDEDSCLD